MAKADHKLLQEIEEHLKTFPERQREVHDIKMLLFGNPKNKEKGMKEKVDEIHTILTQSKGVIAFFGGVKGILGFIVIIGAAMTLIKGWLLK